MSIYYLCPDTTFASGGTATLYRHVDILREAGKDAYILHSEPGFRFPWGSNTTPVKYAHDTLIYPSDLLVIPEIFGPQTADIARGVPKLIFNQNVHYTFRNYPIPPPADCPTPYQDSDVKGTMVLTEYEQDHFKWAFPQHKTWVVRHGIDPTVFYPSLPKKRQIAWMPRKHVDEAQAVFGWLHFTGVLEGWDTVAIDKMPQAETAQVMRESLVFFAFGYPEGGTLPPFEAAMSGCVVVGYGGFASDMDVHEIGHCIESGNSSEFARVATWVLQESTDVLVDRGLAALTTVKRLFPMTGERDALLAVMAEVGQ